MTRQQFLESFGQNTDISNEWITGQQPQLTQNGHNIICKTDNYVPLVVPGLSSPSSSSSSSTSKPQDQSNNSGESESVSSDPVRNRRDKPAAGNRMQTVPDKPAAGSRQHDTKDEKDTEDPTQEVPEWLQNITANLEDLEKRVPVRISEREISGSEASTKVVDKSKLQKHSTYTHFPKDRNCDVCLRTKITRSPYRKRHEGSIPRAEKYGHLITADHKVLNEEGESRNNHRYAVVVQDLPA